MGLTKNKENMQEPSHTRLALCRVATPSKMAAEDTYFEGILTERLFLLQYAIPLHIGPFDDAYC